MISAIKTFVLAVVLILVLSITINRKTLFAHIYNVISPATIAAQNLAENFVSDSVDSTKHYSKKLFDNSVPKFKDSVKSKASAPGRKFLSQPQEIITVKDKEELDELIKSHH